MGKPPGPAPQLKHTIFHEPHATMTRRIGDAAGQGRRNSGRGPKSCCVKVVRLKGKYVRSPASRPPSRCGPSSGKHPKNCVHPTKRADFSRHGYRAAQFDDAFARFLPDEPNIRTLKREGMYEKAEDFAYADDPEFSTIRRKLARWASDNVRIIKDLKPPQPPGFNNRLSANWKLLLQIAQHAASSCGVISRVVTNAAGHADRDLRKIPSRIVSPSTNGPRLSTAEPRAAIGRVTSSFVSAHGRCSFSMSANPA